MKSDKGYIKIVKELHSGKHGVGQIRHVAPDALKTLNKNLRQKETKRINE